MFGNTTCFHLCVNKAQISAKDCVWRGIIFKALAVVFPYNFKKMSNRETTHRDSQFQQSTNPSVRETKINSFPSRPESTNPQCRV